MANVKFTSQDMQSIVDLVLKWMPWSESTQVREVACNHSDGTFKQVQLHSHNLQWPMDDRGHYATCTYWIGRCSGCGKIWWSFIGLMPPPETQLPKPIQDGGVELNLTPTPNHYCSPPEQQGLPRRDGTKLQ